MSLSTVGVWQIGVWAQTVWADDVWREGSAAIIADLQNGGSSDPARRYLSIDEVERLRKAYARAKGVEFERDNQPPAKPRKPVIEAVRAVIDIDTTADQVVEPIFTALKKQPQLQSDTDDQFDLQAEIKALEAHIEEHRQNEEESLILLMMAA